MDRTHLTALLELAANYTGVEEACHYVKELLPPPQHLKGLIANVQGDVWFELVIVKGVITQSEDKLASLRRAEHTRDSRQTCIEIMLAIAYNRGWETVLEYMFYKLQHFTEKTRTHYDELKFLEEAHKELEAEIRRYNNKYEEVTKEREELFF